MFIINSLDLWENLKDKNRIEISEKVLTAAKNKADCVDGIITEVFTSSVEKIDFTKFAESMALEITLPLMEESKGEEVLLQLIKGFLESRGATLQLNLLDSALLKEAREHPEQHRDIIVRVCGFSQYFVLMNKERQEEIISRAVRGM